MCSSDVFLTLLAILFPPLPVWVKRGICSADSFINILLCTLGFIPGLLHAWYIIFKHPDPPYDYDYTQGAHNAEYGQGQANGRIYVFVHDGSPSGSARGPIGQPKIQPHMNYGSTFQAPPQHHQNQEEGVAGPSSGGETNAPPPSYAQVVAGDHKIQTQD
ncbi:hypothetical protein QBC38DRAFT_509900 [Podospora fimiseda]|uniref:Plasma membrane proteolipid 3 n=1 Tax=Podospora fimiseda TaxID=252190 RepID=A0AAN7H2C8_9PEZI|nr:hypothetical protein QBC38DRAFT_509900 [Podospora fimiseda]